MKNDILHSGKLYKFQREHIYQIHLNKINEISKKRSSFLNINNDKFLPTHPSSYKMEQQLKVREQNDRLLKKLNQISNRKKCQILMSEEDFHNNVNKYIELQKSYRQKYRHLRQKSLQQENQKIVEKLLDKRKNERSKEEFRRDDDDFFMLKKSRSKKRSPKRQETSMGSQEKSRLKKNQSLIDKPVKKKHLKQQTQRKHNYSTLLPTIEKMEGLKNQTVDHGELLGLIKKYENQVHNTQTTKEKQSNLMNSLEKYEEVFEAESNTKAQVNNQQKQNPQTVEQIQYIKRSQPLNLQKKQNPQQTTLSSDKNREFISYSEPLKGQNPMDPTLKFQKIRRKKKAKKRQTIDQVKEENQYQDEAFQVDAQT